MAENPWKVRQYCYFWLASEVLTAEDLTQRVGVEPDRTTVMGSRRTSPRVVPAAHGWEVRCEKHGRIDDPEGGYNAMGWWLTPDQVQLLARMGAGIDSDEYAGDFTAHSPG